VFSTTTTTGNQPTNQRDVQLRHAHAVQNESKTTAQQKKKKTNKTTSVAAFSLLK